MCPHNKTAITAVLHGCSIIESIRQDQTAKGRNYSGAFIPRPLVLDDEAMTLIDECSEGVEY